MSEQYTPGPLQWSARVPGKMAAGIHLSDGQCIGTAHCNADAQLWAVAPDLLAACKAALFPAGDTPQQIHDQLLAAIRKAEGTQP